MEENFMSQLKVTSAKLRSAKSQLDNQNKQLESQIQTLQQVQKRLTSMWQGDANTAFDNVFNKDIQQFATFRNLIRDYGTVLERAAQTYDDKDRKNVEIASKR